MAEENSADRLVARAIESVLDQVPGSVDTSLPEGASAKLQPWAETAAPQGRNKRPLEELLVELEQRVTANPGAMATLPRTRHPALAFFDRFNRGGGSGASQPDGAEGSRRRRRRRGGGGGGEVPARAAAVTPEPQGGRAPGGRRRSRRRGGGGGGGGGQPEAASSGGAPVNQPGQGPEGQGRGPGRGGRRRGRRGRGGGERAPTG